MWSQAYPWLIELPGRQNVHTFVKAVVAGNGSALQCLSEAFRDSDEIAELAVQCSRGEPVSAHNREKQSTTTTLGTQRSAIGRFDRVSRDYRKDLPLMLLQTRPGGLHGIPLAVPPQ